MPKLNALLLVEASPVMLQKTELVLSEFYIHTLLSLFAVYHRCRLGSVYKARYVVCRCLLRVYPKPKLMKSNCAAWADVISNVLHFKEFKALSIDRLVVHRQRFCYPK